MKILVTGAAGFIGAALCRSLCEDSQNEITGIDNINAYYDPRLKIKRLNYLGIRMPQGAESVTRTPAAGTLREPVTNPMPAYAQPLKSDVFRNLSFIRMDITDSERIMKLFEDEKFDIIVNLAAQAGVRYSIDNPMAYAESNIIGFLNLLEAARRFPPKHFVYASSSSVYGGNKKTPFSEDDRVDAPVSLYAATKKSNELMASVYAKLYGLHLTGLRFFTVYGPWGRPDMAPMLFADAITSGKPIKVFNHGDMKRDFTYVGDIVEGICRVMNIENDKKEGESRVLNIGHGSPVDLMEFIKTMEDCLAKKAEMQMLPMQPGDVPVTFADTTKLEQLTGYKATTTLRQGISRFAEWYKTEKS